MEAIRDQKDFPGIQSKVNAFITPDDIGRIPSKIASSFSGFTAEQWRNWTLIFSLYALPSLSALSMLAFVCQILPFAL